LIKSTDRSLPVEDKTLLGIAISASIVGIAALYTIMRLTEPTEAAPFEFSSLDSEDTITVRGQVLSSSGSDKATFIKIVVISQADVLFFGPADLQPGDTVKVTGKVERHEGKHEVIAQRIAKE
jgi:hypothetical protein